MLSLLDLVGTIGASVLGLPGILGMALGMTTRNWAIGAVLGAVIGFAAPYILGGSHSAHVAISSLEYSVSVLVGVLAGLLGVAVRRKGVAA